MAVIKQNGVEHYKLVDRAVDSFAFSEFIEEVRDKNGDDKICFFLDNLRVHKSLLVKDVFEDCEIAMVYNAPYSPDGNKIEIVFGIMKKLY